LSPAADRSHASRIEQHPTAGKADLLRPPVQGGSLAWSQAPRRAMAPACPARSDQGADAPQPGQQQKAASGPLPAYCLQPGKASLLVPTVFVGKWGLGCLRPRVTKGRSAVCLRGLPGALRPQVCPLVFLGLFRLLSPAPSLQPSSPCGAYSRVQQKGHPGPHPEANRAHGACWQRPGAGIQRLGAGIQRPPAGIPRPWPHPGAARCPEAGQGRSLGLVRSARGAFLPNGAQSGSYQTLQAPTVSVGTWRLPPSTAC
jgi:hypothetical protein